MGYDLGGDFMVKDLVSVIIPVYNAEKYLRRCIDSVIMQSYENLQIILVDDGSVDGSGSVCDEYASVDSRITVIHKENGGVGDARNVGLNSAVGEFVVFVDADDFIDIDYIKLFYDNSSGIDMVVSDAKYTHVCGKCEEFNSHNNIITIVFNDNYDCSAPYSHYTVWGTFIRRDIIGDLKFSTDLCVGEDTLFYFSLLKRCRTIRHLPQNLYHYMIYDNSAAHGKFDEKRISEICAWERVLELFDDMPNLKLNCTAQYMVRCMGAYEQIYLTKSGLTHLSHLLRRNVVNNRHVLKNCSIHSYFKAKLYLLIYFKPLFDLYLVFKKVRLK